MNKRRLLKLADLLEADAKNRKGIRFDLATWGDLQYGDEVGVNCGTAACAMGLAVLSGAFKRAGLFNAGSETCVSPAIRDATGYDAAEVLFCIAPSEAQFLFSKLHYPDDKRTGAVGERYVAKRIRDFVAGKVKP